MLNRNISTDSSRNLLRELNQLTLISPNQFHFNNGYEVPPGFRQLKFSRKTIWHFYSKFFCANVSSPRLYIILYETLKGCLSKGVFAKSPHLLSGCEFTFTSQIVLLLTLISVNDDERHASAGTEKNRKNISHWSLMAFDIVDSTFKTAMPLLIAVKMMKPSLRGSTI